MTELIQTVKEHIMKADILTAGTIAIGTLLCLVLVTADMVSAATYSTNNGEVMIEAENYSRLGGSIGGKWYKNTAIKGYKGSGYMQSGTSNFKGRFQSDLIRVEYDIDFKETGTYYLHLRTLANGHTQNGFFATMNGRQFNYGHSNAHMIYVKKGGFWSWYTAGATAHQHGYKVSINITKKGVHKLAIVRRDPGSRVDRILLTKKRNAPIHATTLGVSSSSVSSGSTTSSSGSTTSSSGSSGPTTSSSVSGSAFVQGSDGLVKIEAYDYSAKKSRSNHSWAEVRHLGIDAMEAIPDSGALIHSGYVSTSPYLQFNIKFTKTGTHYVWLRGSCQGKDNTAHVGFKGNAVTSGTKVVLPLSKTGWTWSNNLGNGNRAKINVTKTGVQTVEVYMREDGFILRDIVLTNKSGYRP